MTWGVLRHTILLPCTAREWSEERRRLVLAHELAHVKRNDGLMQVFVQIVCSIHWFNPLVWYAAHRIRIERERACDDQVLTLGTAATDYADHLVQIVRGLRSSRSLSFAAVSIAQPTQLETRLVSILDSRGRRRTLSKIGTALLGAVAGLLTVSIAAVGVTAAVPLPPVFVAAIKIAPPTPASKPASQPAVAPQRTRIGNGDPAANNAIVAPRIVESKPPIYTDEALKARIEGTVTLEAAVDVQGTIKILRVVKGLGYGLDERAIGAVLDWKFAPATRNGTPVEAITQVDVDFKLPATLNEAITLGPGVTPPTVISRVEPQYTDEARDARYQGTVVVSATIQKDGTLKVDKVLRELDYGLTEKAVEALQQWKFKPGMRNGEAVAVSLKIEVNFNLR
jgi:TonB family protein